MKFHCTNTMRRIELFDAIRFDAAGLSRDVLMSSVRRETFRLFGLASMIFDKDIICQLLLIPGCLF